MHAGWTFAANQVHLQGKPARGEKRIGCVYFAQRRYGTVYRFPRQRRAALHDQASKLETQLKLIEGMLNDFTHFALLRELSLENFVCLGVHSSSRGRDLHPRHAPKTCSIREPRPTLEAHTTRKTLE